MEKNNDTIKVGDKVIIKAGAAICSVRAAAKHEPFSVKNLSSDTVGVVRGVNTPYASLFAVFCKEDGSVIAQREDIAPYPPVTERIKTFEDAFGWCRENSHKDLCDDYFLIRGYNDMGQDIKAYLMLKIVTTAINEGWEPTPTSEMWLPMFNCRKELSCIRKCCADTIYSPWNMCFKSRDLAEFAVSQFKGIYLKFLSIPNFTSFS